MQPWRRWLGRQQLSPLSITLLSGSLVVFGSITGYLSSSLDIWLDEAFSLKTASDGPLHAIKEAVRFELQPPFYFVVLSIVQMLSKTVFASRVLSIVCGSAAVCATLSLERRYFGAPSTGVVACAIGSSPFLIWAGTEIRCYAMVILFTAVLTALFHEAFLCDGASRRSRVAYVLLATVALYTHYYLGFLLLGHSIGLMGIRRFESLRIHLLLMVIVAALFAPMAFFVPGQVQQHAGTPDADVSLAEEAKNVLWRIEEYSCPTQRSVVGGWAKWLWRGVLAVCLLSIACSVWARRVEPESIALWLSTAVVALCFLALRMTTNPDMNEVRHTAVLFVPAVLSVFAMIRSTAGKTRRDRVDVPRRSV